jgi:hypothetical protein
MAILKQSTAYTRTFMMISSTDHISGLTGATVTVNLSKAGGAGAAAGGAVSQVDATNCPGLYKIALTTTDTNTLGDLAFCCTATGADPTNFIDQVCVNILGDTLPADVTQWNGTNVSAPATAGIPDVNVKNINNTAAATPGASGGILIAGSNAATVTFADGFVISRTTANSTGMAVSGSGTGHGLQITSGNGATGDALHATSAATNGNGFSIAGNGTGHGMNVQSGAGTNADGIHAQSNAASGLGNGFFGQGGAGGDGMMLTGGATGRGLHVIGGSTSGSGFRAEGNISATASYGAHFIGIGAQEAFRVEATGTGIGLNVIGGNASGATPANPGIKVVGGAASTTGGGTSAAGVQVTGGAGAATTNGASAGATFTGGGTTTVSGNDGVIITGTGNGNGLTAAHAGTGKDLNATTSGPLQVNATQINSVSASSVTTINANIGETQPINFTGTGAGALVKSDMQDIAGAAVATGAAQIGVNIVNAGGSAITAAAGVMAVNTTQWGGTSTGSVPPDATFLHSGTAQAGTSTSITLDAGASGTNGTYDNCVVFIRSGTGAGQAQIITSYTGASKVAGVGGTWATNPDATSVFTVWAVGPVQATISGTVNANVVSINSVPTSSVTTVNPNQGTTQPINFSGAGGTALVEATASISGTVAANVTQIAGSTTAAANAAISALDVGRGSCASGGSLTSVPTSVWTIGGAGNAADQFIGRVIVFDYDTPTVSLQGQAAVITGNTSGATPTFTVAATTLTTAPAAGDTFSVF